MGDEEVHGEVLAVHEGVHCVPDGRGHHVGVDVAVVLVVKGGAGQNHAEMKRKSSDLGAALDDLYLFIRINDLISPQKIMVIHSP